MISEQVFGSMQPILVINAACQMSTRKHRLFACACCRRFWHLIRDPRSHESVRVAELYADGQATRKMLSRVHKEAEIAQLEWTGRLMRGMDADFGPDEPVLTEPKLIARKQRLWFLPIRTAKYASAWEIRGSSTREVSWCSVLIFVPDARDWDRVEAEAGDEAKMSLASEVKTQMAHLRDVFASHRPIDSRWLTSTVIDLARTIYDERAFDRMPILADALMDAGCDSPEIIAHCRQSGEHIRGCWVLDSVLGKE